VSTPHRVVVVGGGFGGLQAVRGLRRAPVQITLVDRRNYHLFQPLLYQVATGALSSVEIASPLRQIFRRQRNVRVLLAEVTGFDVEHRRVVLGKLPNGAEEEALEYDTLVVAGGAAYSYFGHDDWAPFAPELKSLEGALELRSRILKAFEAAEVEEDPERRRAWLTFAVVGAGPTGVEMAGQIAEIAHDTLPRDFRDFDPRATRVLLIEAGDRVLATFPPSLSHRAEQSLEQLGITTLLNSTVVGVGPETVTVEHSENSREEMQASRTTRVPPGAAHRRVDEREEIPARTAVWAAGVTASPLAATLASAAGAEVDRAGRILVEPDLTLRGHPEVFAIGDMVAVRTDGGVQQLPGVAPVAMQQGRHVAQLIRTGERRPFHYRDKGNLATIGHAKAVADINGLQLSGFFAWLTWLVVHLFYLIGFENRILVLLRWMFSYVTRGRGARVIHER
jgi:NADH:ubiquinone reductase (H+-translocating)